MAKVIGIEANGDRPERDVPVIISYTQTITGKIDTAISAERKIVDVKIFNPATGRLISVQPTLAADRLSGSIKITQTITNAEVSIITQ